MAKQTPGYKATIIKRKVFGGEKVVMKDSIGREWSPWRGVDPYHGVIPVVHSGFDKYTAGIFSIVYGTDTGYIKIHKEGSEFGGVKVMNGTWVATSEGLWGLPKPEGGSKERGK
jgi:hypothetical protein